MFKAASPVRFYEENFQNDNLEDNRYEEIASNQVSNSFSQAAPLSYSRQTNQYDFSRPSDSYRIKDPIDKRYMENPKYASPMDYQKSTKPYPTRIIYAPVKIDKPISSSVYKSAPKPSIYSSDNIYRPAPYSASYESGPAYRPAPASYPYDSSSAYRPAPVSVSYASGTSSALQATDTAASSYKTPSIGYSDNMSSGSEKNSNYKIDLDNYGPKASRGDIINSKFVAIPINA